MKWTDHESNPLISPPERRLFRIIGDPTVLNPGETPDGRWHLWASTVPGLHHFTSSDGVDWQAAPMVMPGNYRPGMRATILKTQHEFYLYYEEWRLVAQRNRIVVMRSEDLVSWSDPVVLLEQDLPWERQSWLTRPLTCPGVCYHPVQQRYYLFYSTGMVRLKGPKVAGIAEPVHIGLAVSESPTGPFRKRTEPFMSADPDDPWHSIGAGAMQCYWVDELGLLLGLNNGIYRRQTPKGPADGSAIHLYTSHDGERWDLRTRDPVLAPNGAGKFLWKDALVYQMGLTAFEGTYYLYYNARNTSGVEYIGLATCPVRDVHEFLNRTTE